jgi:hypothetical protein
VGWKVVARDAVQCRHFVDLARFSSLKGGDFLHSLKLFGFLISYF